MPLRSRLRAERDALCGSWAKAEKNFQRALTVARRQRGIARTMSGHRIERPDPTV